MAISPIPTRSRSNSSISSTSSTAPLPSFEALAPPRPPTTTEAEETRLVIPGLNNDVRLLVDAGPGCGGIAWPAGEVLSRYLAYRHEHDPDKLKGRTIIELGSGTGLVGIVAGMLESTANIWVTDQPQLLDLMRSNAEINIPGSSNVHVSELNWGEDIPENVPAKEATLVLAADCVYFEPAFPLLVHTLCLLAPLGKEIEILFCWKKRRKADKRFFALLKKHFDQEMVMDDKKGERERYGRDGVSLLRLTRRR
ncbi:putative methyltransferase-domain-containing protein [Naematelia encephala]|uniref:Protein-lysine N-methyltransferase EFM6 n=1 Tax=Naematelia encephala TaxID=71784 RepID=A0A1Y2BM81_9TREE|nr:putative methyltransferase-domain-containing protein [Naematelia encephala]